MKQNLDKNTKAIITRATELFADIKDQSDIGLRNFLKGRQQIDAGISYSETRKNKYSLIIHNMDYEGLRFKQRELFAENAVFDPKQIEFLKEYYELTNIQARAVYFANLISLCDYYEEKAVEYHMKLIEEFLDNFINKVEPQLIDKCLRKFLSDASEAQNKKGKKAGITVDMDSLVEHAHLFVKTPNVGRPLESISQKAITEAEISQAILDLFKEKLSFAIDGSAIEKTFKVSQKEVYKKLGLSRPTFNKRMDSLYLDFHDLVLQLQHQFALETARTNPLTKE